MTKTTPMQVVRELQLTDGKSVFGVAHDGQYLWHAEGEKLCAADPNTGERKRELALNGDAGTAFDGRYLYQLTKDRIHKIDPESGELVGDIPAPGKGNDSGLTWAEGLLWVGQYRDRKIHQIDPSSGEVLRTIESDRFVTGVTWVDGQLWHGSLEAGQCELRHVDANTGEVLSRLTGPSDIEATGLGSDGSDLFCGGGDDGKVRVIRRPH